jgi:hypothetical protein
MSSLERFFKAMERAVIKTELLLCDYGLYPNASEAKKKLLGYVVGYPHLWPMLSWTLKRYSTRDLLLMATMLFQRTDHKKPRDQFLRGLSDAQFLAVINLTVEINFREIAHYIFYSACISQHLDMATFIWEKCSQEIKDSLLANTSPAIFGHEKANLNYSLSSEFRYKNKKCMWITTLYSDTTLKKTIEDLLVSFFCANGDRIAYHLHYLIREWLIRNPNVTPALFEKIFVDSPKAQALAQAQQIRINVTRENQIMKINNAVQGLSQKVTHQHEALY